MPLKIKTSNDIIGCAEKQNDGYTIFIDPDILKKDELSDFVISLVIHEIWHVKQMEDGRMILNTAHTVVRWEGMHYTMETISHDNRLWEIEAKRMESKYLNCIKEQI